MEEGVGKWFYIVNEAKLVGHCAQVIQASTGLASTSATCDLHSHTDSGRCRYPPRAISRGSSQLACRDFK